MLKYYDYLEKPNSYFITLFDYISDPVIDINDCDDETKDRLFKIIEKLESKDPLFKKTINEEKFSINSIGFKEDTDDYVYGRDNLTMIIHEIFKNNLSIINYENIKNENKTDDKLFLKLVYLGKKFLEINTDYNVYKEEDDYFFGELSDLSNYILACYSLIENIYNIKNIYSIKNYIDSLVIVLLFQKKITEEEAKDIRDYLKTISTSKKIEIPNHIKSFDYYLQDAWYITPNGWSYNWGGPSGHRGMNPAYMLRNHYYFEKIFKNEDSWNKTFKSVYEEEVDDVQDNLIDNMVVNHELNNSSIISDDLPFGDDNTSKSYINNFKLYDNDFSTYFENIKYKREYEMFKNIHKYNYERKMEQKKKQEQILEKRNISSVHLDSKEIYQRGYITFSQFRNFLNLIGMPFSLDYIGDDINDKYDYRIYDRKILNTILGIMNAGEIIDDFIKRLYKESNNIERDLKTALYELSCEEFLIRCCGFHKVLSHHDVHDRNTIVTSDTNYKESLKEYIEHGWNVDFVKPYVIMDGRLQEMPDYHEKILEFHYGIDGGSYGNS